MQVADFRPENSAFWLFKEMSNNEFHMRKIPIKTCGFLLMKGLHILGYPAPLTNTIRKKRFNAPQPPGIAGEFILKLEK